MGTSRGRSRSPLAVDDSVWATEAEGEEEVLSAFADESSLQPSVTPSVAAAPTHETLSGRGPRGSREAWRRGLRVLSPHTPMRDVVRTVLIGCLSAMALGASFAIGFGYVWSDLGSNAVPSETRSTPDVTVPGNNSPAATPVDATAPSPEARSSLPTPSNDAPRSADSEVREPSATPASATSGRIATRPSSIASRFASRTAAARGLAVPSPAERGVAAAPAEAAAVDPGPAFGVPLQAAAPDAAGVPAVPAMAGPLSGESEILPSQPMLSAGGAVISKPISPEPPARATSSTARAVDPVEPPPARAVRSALDAVREAINRYQAAYTRKDVGAMALVWPSLDIAGVARAFDDVDRQALMFDSCHVTAAGRFATAVCPGRVRYVGRVGNRQLQERQGTWTIALERRGDTWQFTRLNVR